MLLASQAWAQEARGSVAGRVIDPQGSAVPKAQVTVHNTETNFETRTQTGESGYFDVSLLNTGTYSITVEASGFKRVVRSGITVSVAGRADLEIELPLGQISEKVEVTAEAPILDTVSASGGRLLDRRQIMELPFNDLNPFTLVALAPGMQWTGVPENRRPFDIRGTSKFNTAGGVGQNEYMIDGTPVTGSDRRVGFVPPSDSVEEFRLETTPFDASYGHTSGAVVNVQTKAGTNQFHGSAYDQHWQQRWNATPHFLRLAYDAGRAAGAIKPGDPKQPSGHSNNYGGTIGGPVRIPHLYNGRDKFFFFFSYNGIQQQRVDQNPTYSVPKAAWRTGDFSDLLAVDAVKYTIYDPRSAQLVNGRVVRTPFPNNQTPLLNPMYDAYTKLLPMPNNPAGLVTPEGRRNYLAAGQLSGEAFDSLINRFDYNISGRHRLYGRWYWNHNLESQGDWAYETKPGLATNGLDRGGHGAGLDYIWVIGNNTTMTVGANGTRFWAGNKRPVQTRYKPTDVGLPAYLDDKAGSLTTLPSVVFGVAPSIGSSYPAVTERGTTVEAKAAFITVVRNHSLKYGYNERRYQFTSAGPGNTSGRFAFDQTFVRQADNTTTADNLGLEWAAFRLGLPTSMSIDTNDSGYWVTPFRALYLHDDWRVNSRLSLNLGLRFEDEGGFTERYNRSVGGQFYPDLALPITNAAQAAYAANAVPELAASDFHVLGGTRYLGVDGSNRYYDGSRTWLPRLGAVYRIDSKTVVRGGYGIFYDTFNVNNYLYVNNTLQFGYSQPTSTPVSTDNGLTFCCGVGAATAIGARTPLSDPFPVRADGTRFDQPFGNKAGSVAFAGRTFGGIARDFVPPFQQRWRLSVQRQIAKDIVVDVSYNGSWTKEAVNRQINSLDAKYWATGNTRNQAVDDNLLRNVANPFNVTNLSGLAGSDPTLYAFLKSQSFFTSTTIRKNQLLRPYPQMGSVILGDDAGRVRYHDLQVLAEKRFSKGFTTSFAYTYVRSSVKDWYANEFDPLPSWRENDLTRPHRWVWSGIVELPFGKGHPWLNRGIANHVFGGWRTSWIWQVQSGTPTVWANRFFYGDINQIGDLFNHDAVNSKNIHQWFDPSIVYRGSGPIPAGFVGFDGRTASQPGQFHVTVFPKYLSDLRTDGIKNIDLKVLREFTFAERARAAFSVDLLNLTNHTNFGAPNVDPTSPNFGMVTSQNGLSRVLQFNLRIGF